MHKLDFFNLLLFIRTTGMKVSVDACHSWTFRTGTVKESSSLSVELCVFDLRITFKGQKLG